jgi:hypothetical protein
VDRDHGKEGELGARCLALKWLRADLAQRASQAKDAKQWPEVRVNLTFWKNDPGLASVRDPAWLATMPPADRKSWEALWRDVDALLASIAQRAGPPPAKPRKLKNHKSVFRVRPVITVLDSHDSMASDRRASSWLTVSRAIHAKSKIGDA